MEILVLANSKKLGGRCIAGIDVVTGKWVRPISTTEHGEFTWEGCSIMVGGATRPVKSLDIIEISVGVNKPGIGHPEDFLTNHGNWRFVRSLSVGDATQMLDKFLDNGHDLLINRTSSVPESVARSGLVTKSLCIIRIDSAKFETNYKNQLRVVFSHKGRKYDLPVTDEDPWVADAKRSPSSVEKGPWYFTISLGEPYNGNMWKLIAGAILAKA